MERGFAEIDENAANRAPKAPRPSVRSYLEHRFDDLIE
jgi:hypothetical protein